MKKMTENKKNMLKEPIKQSHTGASLQKIKEMFIPLGHSAHYNVQKVIGDDPF